MNTLRTLSFSRSLSNSCRLKECSVSSSPSRSTPRSSERAAADEDEESDDDDSDDEDATLVVSRKPRTLSTFNIINARMGMRPSGVSRLPLCKC